MKHLGPQPIMHSLLCFTGKVNKFIVHKYSRGSLLLQISTSSQTRGTKVSVFSILTSQMRFQSRRKWPQPARLGSNVTPLTHIAVSRLQMAAKATENHDKTHNHQTWMGDKEMNARARISFLVAGIGEHLLLLTCDTA